MRYLLVLFLLALSATHVHARPDNLRPRSVGSRELRRHSVTASKLAPGAVTRDALSSDVLSALDVAGVPGAQGPAGAPGEPGPQGPAGPGAKAFRYSAQSSATPTPETALDFNGLKLTATCQQSGTQTAVGLNVLSAEAAVGHEHFALDTGTDLHTPGAPQTGTIVFELEPGVELVGGFPPIDAPNYGRAFGSLLYVTPTRMMTVTVVVIINAADQTCQVMGVATPATL